VQNSPPCSHSQNCVREVLCFQYKSYNCEVFPQLSEKLVELFQKKFCRKQSIWPLVRANNESALRTQDWVSCEKNLVASGVSPPLFPSPSEGHSVSLEKPSLVTLGLHLSTIQSLQSPRSFCLIISAKAETSAYPFLDRAELNSTQCTHIPKRTQLRVIF